MALGRCGPRGQAVQSRAEMTRGQGLVRAAIRHHLMAGNIVLGIPQNQSRVVSAVVQVTQRVELLH